MKIFELPYTDNHKYVSYQNHEWYYIIFDYLFSLLNPLYHLLTANPFGSSLIRSILLL